jgi:hypothetical protein
MIKSVRFSQAITAGQGISDVKLSMADQRVRDIRWTGSTIEIRLHMDPAVYVVPASNVQVFVEEETETDYKPAPKPQPEPESKQVVEYLPEPKTQVKKKTKK